MALPAFVRPEPILKARNAPVDPARRPAATAPACRTSQVLQSRREPAQLCLFLRFGASDVK